MCCEAALAGDRLKRGRHASQTCWLNAVPQDDVQTSEGILRFLPMGHPGARGGGPCPGEHRPQSQCTVMGWDMFPIAFAIQNSYPMSDSMSHSSCNSKILARFQPICFPGRGPFAQGGCRGLARGAGHERSLPVEGRALQRLQGGSPHIRLGMDENRNVSLARLPNVSKGQQVNWQLIPPRASASTRKRRRRRRTSACNA
jgi:hypothetical protein